MSAERFSKDSPGVTFVKVSDQSPVPVKVFGFWERSWDSKETATTSTVTEQPKIKYAATASAPVNLQNLPDKFPQHWKLKLDTELCAVKYSHKTKVNYLYYIRLLCKILQKPPEEIQQGDIKQFLAFLEKEMDYSAASMNLALSAIKFFYQRVLQKDIIKEQHRPRQDRRLPIVLSKTEIKKILAAERNLKHRLLMILVYASGLRVSEVVNLKKENIDITRKAIIITAGKGRKDRYTILPEAVIKDLTEYYRKYNITDWIFPGAKPDEHLNIRSAQHIFKDALKAAKINKTASTHCLRHSFATHLLESGTDIRYIQDLLGHSSLRTTERYTHVARKKALSIPSPFDHMDEGE
ncbi:tyrosine-type recombinase/integrase [Treponema sp. R6D11]